MDNALLNKSRKCNITLFTISTYELTQNMGIYRPRAIGNIIYTFRKPLFNTMTMGNLGFRCAYSVPMADPNTLKKKPKEAEQQSAKEAKPVTTPRPPRRHFRNETWEYKVRKVLEDVIAGDRDTANSVLEGLSGKKKKRDEL